MTCTSTIWRTGWIHPFLQIILVPNSQRSKEFIQFCSPKSSNDFCLLFCLFSSSMVKPQDLSWHCPFSEFFAYPDESVPLSGGEVERPIIIVWDQFDVVLEPHVVRDLHGKNAIVVNIVVLNQQSTLFPSPSHLFSSPEVEFLKSEELSLNKSSPLPAQLPRPGRS